MQPDNRDDIAKLLLLDTNDLNEVACCEIRNELLRASKRIEAQLSAQKRTFGNGDQMTPAQYKAWRSKAITAKNHIDEQYCKAGKRLKDIRRSKHGSTNA